MSDCDRVMIRRLRAEFREAADPERAQVQQAYMKSSMPYLGLMTPDLRRICRDVFRARPADSAASWEDSMLTLWREADYREERYAALELLRHKPYREFITPQLLPTLEEFIVTGAWWDYVDGIAVNSFGQLLTHYPGKLKPLLRRWSRGDDMWLTRTAILAQLKFKERTDVPFLFAVMEPSLDSREFFLRKAIGWALREYSKTDPQTVIDYIAANQDRLSGLSKREGLKVLKKQGLV